METLSFDTTFLIDFQRERKAGTGPAHEFLETNRESPAVLSVVAWGEFAEGLEDLNHPAFVSMMVCFEVAPVTEQTAAIYAGIVRDLRPSGKLIGTNDLWIASEALRRKVPLVTRNVKDFTRIPGLQVRSY